jgi:hypothetical protein
VGVPQRFLELIERALLADLAERLERLAVALGLAPDGGDQDDLLVQPGRSGAVHGEAPHQYDARLRARAFDHRNPRQPGLEALREEAREQPADQPVLEMDLHDLRRIAAIGESRRLEGDGADRCLAPPFVDPLAALARADAQVVERILPAGLLGESWVIGIELEGCRAADGLALGGGERQAGACECGARDPLQVVGVDADLGA